MLKLKLPAHERFVVNGAVIQTARYAEFTVLNRANILREKEIMQPEEASTPTRRLYFLAQGILLNGKPTAEQLSLFRQLSADLKQAFVDPGRIARVTEAQAAIERGDHYHAIRALRPLVSYETNLLGMRLLAPEEG